MCMCPPPLVVKIAVVSLVLLFSPLVVSVTTVSVRSASSGRRVPLADSALWGECDEAARGCSTGALTGEGVLEREGVGEVRVEAEDEFGELGLCEREAEATDEEEAMEQAFALLGAGWAIMTD